jgi:DNA-binding response OmpR family regulator
MNAEDKPRLLVVEDERHLATGLKLNFEIEGFTVDVAATAREAGLCLVGPHPYDLLILDVMLPDLDGFELCRRLREAGDYTPVIMLTARHATEDRVKGLEVGADDYLGKPFELAELVARVRSILRRRGWEKSTTDPERQGSVLQFGRARIDFDTHEVTVAERTVKLTQLELDLVRYFADNAGRVVSRGELLEKVWKLRNSSNTRSVDNFIVRLRKHFEPDPANPVHFLSVRGSGYRFLPSPAARKR